MTLAQVFSPSHDTSTNLDKSSLDGKEIFAGFKTWLIAKNYSSSTIRNYFSDINAYLIFFKKSKLNINFFDIFSPNTVASYLQTIANNPAYSRYTSSLSKFFQYALDQNIIKIDPLKQAKKIKKPSIEELLADYQSFLTKKRFSTSTIRNYLNDLRQFIDWSKNYSEPR